MNVREPWAFPWAPLKYRVYRNNKGGFYWAKPWTLTVLFGLFCWWLQNNSAWPQVWLAIWASMSSGRSWNHLTWSNRPARWLGASRPPQLIHGIYGVQREFSNKTRLNILSVMDRVASWSIPRWIWRSMLRRCFLKNTQLTRWKKFGG
jgi:hypothetical protein